MDGPLGKRGARGDGLAPEASARPGSDARLAKAATASNSRERLGVFARRKFNFM